jgi:hypothetical protein
MAGKVVQPDRERKALVFTRVYMKKPRTRRGAFPYIAMV